MPRRSHRKSRYGCQECKRRHLKCDETKPKCINCITAHLTCPFEASSSQAIERDTESRGNVATVSSSSSPSDLTDLAGNGQQQDTSSLNMVHLELLHHWSTGLYCVFHPTVTMHYVEYAAMCTRHGLKHPFLMRQILATSALHLSLTQPEQKDFYHHYATDFQASAIREYAAILGKLDEHNIIAAFLTSSLIGMHLFCEIFNFGSDVFGDTLDALLSCMSLLRDGIKFVIGDWWPFLRQSELEPVLTTAHDIRDRAWQRPVQLSQLQKLINDADISPTSRDTYKKTLEELELLFAVQSSLSDADSSSSSNMIFSFLVTTPKEFSSLISARRPEALIILAYYAVLLHLRRSFWAIGSAGRFLIENIATTLGRHWEEWLAWPLSMLLAS